MKAILSPPEKVTLPALRAEVEAARSATRSATSNLKRAVVGGLSPAAWARAHPLGSLATAIAAGLGVGLSAGLARREKSQVPTATCPKPQAAPSAPSRTGWTAAVDTALRLGNLALRTWPTVSSAFLPRGKATCPVRSPASPATDPGPLESESQDRLVESY